jgi:excisionase family DNA binding protein
MAKAITREAAASELSCSVRTIDRLRAAGELDEIAVGAGVRILAASLDEYVDRKRNVRRRAGAGAVERAHVDVTNLRASVLKARKAGRRG